MLRAIGASRPSERIHDTAYMRPDERYQVKGKLGEGGMGTVYRAFDTGLLRDVAIKVIRRDVILDEGARQRFDQEAKAAGMLNHPGIVTIHDRGEMNGQPFIVMEFVEGRTLDDLLKNGQPSPHQLQAILRQVAAGLDYAHARQVVHRDIKPANIMVQADGTAKIMDFGIAKAEMGGGGLTAVGMMVGSPQYVPPERYTTGVVSGSTDLWALAVTAYEALAGRRPFEGDNLDTLTYQICHQSAPDPSEFQPAIPKPAAAALLKALSKKPEDRFPTCSSFVDALAAGFRQPANSPPPPPGGAATVVSPLPLPLPPAPAAKKTKPYLMGGIAAGSILAAVLWFASQPDIPPKPPRDPSLALVKQKQQPPPAHLTTSTGEMVLVPAGEARLGKAPEQMVNVGAFYIDKTEVPVSANRQFCQETGRAIGSALAAAAPDLPVVNVSQEDARTFAVWAAKRLPTAEEWEKAARGSEGQALPWRGEPRQDRANVPIDRASAASGKLAEVNSFADGASAYGALHLLGNVWEWTATPTQAPPPAQFQNYRKIFRELDPPLSESDVFYQVRGGSFRFVVPLADWTALAWDLSPVPARAKHTDIGFRCVRDAP